MRGRLEITCRRGRVPRALQGAGRDQHHAVRRQLHAGRRAHGGAPEGRRASPTATCTFFTAPDHPKEGGLVAVYPGQRSEGARPILLLAHIDVVEAKREDWTRDPFTLVEENGYFYARGVSGRQGRGGDLGRHADALRAEKFKPRRTIKLALTCGEETAGAFNGAEWLAQNQRDLIDAEFALNEGAGGELDAQGKRVRHERPGGREDLAELSPRGHQSRRPQLAAGEGQRHLPAGRRAVAHRGLRVPGAVQRRHPRLLHAHGEDPGGEGRRRHGRGDERAGQGSGRRARHRAGVGEGSELERHAAHHLRRHHAGRRPCHQRPAAARARQRQLPHLPGRQRRGGARPAREAGGRTRR